MTFGKQILDNYKKSSSDKIETRELANHVYKHKIQALIEKTIKEGIKEYNNQKFYIVWYGYNDRLDPSTAHCKIIGRSTRPKPEWKQTVFSYDPSKSSEKSFKYEWMLPKKETAMEMVVNPYGWHPHIIENITKFLNGNLH